jgi:hypothetical protein
MILDQSLKIQNLFLVEQKSLKALTCKAKVEKQQKARKKAKEGKQSSQTFCSENIKF